MIDKLLDLLVEILLLWLSVGITAFGLLGAAVVLAAPIVFFVQAFVTP